MTLGEKIYELRKTRGLSQEQLAEVLNVSRQSISKWEGNVTYPESDKLIALSDYFQVSLDYLMKADRTDETVIQTETGEVDQATVGEFPDAAEPAKRSQKQGSLLAGATICLASVVGLIWLGLVNHFLPDSSAQMGASSMIMLDGTALLVLFFLGLLIVGTTVIIRFICRK